MDEEVREWGVEKLRVNEVRRSRLCGGAEVSGSERSGTRIIIGNERK